MHPRKYTFNRCHCMAMGKIRRKRFATLTSQQLVPGIICLQISVALLKNKLFTISQPITEQIKCPDLCVPGQMSLQDHALAELISIRSCNSVRTETSSLMC